MPWDAATTARANGCSLRCSTAAARASRSAQGAHGSWAGEAQLIERTVTTAGLPAVGVRVLSKAMARMLLIASKNAPPLMSTPLRAALLMALMIVTGVPMTSAQGQATTAGPAPDRASPGRRRRCSRRARPKNAAAELR